MPAINSPKLHKLQVAKITRQLYERRNFAYICVDRLWKVQQVSDNLQDFGFAPIAIGDDVTDEIDFLVGADVDTSLELPLVTSPTGVPVRVILMPADNIMTIVLMDGYEEFHQQYQLQQKANENQLLLETQQKLMSELEKARTQLELQNTKLQEAARLQTSFLSGVSHEFRSPLTSIMGYTDLLMKAGDTIADMPVADYLHAVQRSGKHLLSLIENLLDHGKFESGEIFLNPKPIDLRQVFDDVASLISPLARTKNIAFILNAEIDKDACVFVDDTRLRQCLINIVGNAIKFTDVGRVTVSAHLKGDLLSVVVQDTGAGISKENLQKIKQPFWQAPNTGKAGTGLGLTITDRIIEMMGGALVIESEPGVGTTARFEVIAPRLEKALEQSAASSAVLPNPINILLAEDDEDIAVLVELLLTEQGASVTVVENGSLALANLQNGSFDLVLMDLHMPILDGFGAVNAIREEGIRTPIVMMTASATDADRERAKQLGCDGYLVKPVEMVDLISVVNQLLPQD